MQPTLAAGTELAISLALPVMADAAGFTALGFTRVRGVRTVGDMAEQWQTSVTNLANRSYPHVAKTWPSAIQQDIDLLHVDDAGQALLMQAFGQRGPAAFRLAQPAGGFWFTALVTSRAIGGRSPDALLARRFTLVLTAPPIEVSL
ncbi:hypothetical protein ACUXVY_22030 [Chromobacterium haemolyticum]|uniref:hypothetical protein n=1 Tax=Chromobacterium haemolyticum TaxID=394935 RepID=UPI0040563178